MKRFVRIAGSLTLIALLAWRIDLRSVAEPLSGMSWQWWLAGVICYFLAQLLSAVRWRRLSRPLGFTQRTRTYASYIFVGNFFNLILPTSVGGDVARAWYLGRGTGKGPRAVLSVLADRLNGLYVLVALACLAALAVPLPPWALSFILMSAVAGLICLILLWRTGKQQQLEDDERSTSRWQELTWTLAFYRRSPRLLRDVTVLSLGVQLLNVLLVWCVALAIGAAVPLSFCFVFMPIVTLLTLAPISVNGMGVREGATLLLLTPLGVPEAQAVALSLLWFSVFLTAGLAGGVLFLLSKTPVAMTNDQFSMTNEKIPVAA